MDFGYLTEEELCDLMCGNPEEEWSDKMAKVKVNNVPEYANNFPIWVCKYSEDDHKLWFWGAWENEEVAEKVARQIDGVVVENEDFVQSY